MSIEDEILSIVSVFDRIAQSRDPNPPCTKFCCSTCGGMVAHIQQNLDIKIVVKIHRVLQKASSRNISNFGKWKKFITYRFSSEYKSILHRELMEERQVLDMDDTQKMDRYIFGAKNLLSKEDPDYRSVISSGIELALKSDDSSLVETIILVLGEESADYPDLIELAKEKSKIDTQLKRVLYNKLRKSRKDLRDYVGSGTSAGY